MGTRYIKDQALKNVTRMSTRRARKRDEKGPGDTTGRYHRQQINTNSIHTCKTILLHITRVPSLKQGLSVQRKAKA